MNHKTTTSRCRCGCGRPKGPHHRGWSIACYTRWWKAGADPETGPPPPWGTRRAAAIARREDFTDLREARVPVEDAARRAGISLRTARNWEPLRKRGALFDLTGEVA